MPLKGKDGVKRKLGSRSDQLVRGLAMELLGGMMRMTPVDTGRARANWNAGIGEVDASTGREPANKRKGVRDGGAVAAATPTLRGSKVGDVIYLTNSMPYIGALEDGSSKQAGSGMVAATVANLSEFTANILTQIGGGSVGTYGE